MSGFRPSSAGRSPPQRASSLGTPGRRPLALPLDRLGAPLPSLPQVAPGRVDQLRCSTISVALIVAVGVNTDGRRPRRSPDRRRFARRIDGLLAIDGLGCRHGSLGSRGLLDRVPSLACRSRPALGGLLAAPAARTGSSACWRLMVSSLSSPMITRVYERPPGASSAPASSGAACIGPATFWATPHPSSALRWRP